MEILGLDRPQTVLVIEDKLSFAHRLVRWLRERGHTVFGFTGVLSVDDGVLLGTNPLADDMPFEVSLATVQVCFLDHYFEGDAFNGTSLTKVLVPMGIKVCGMSSVDPANASMMRVGAVCAYRKDALGRMLV
ncbi:MAG: hypothetical protein JST12_11665 [Armatimonadetes bacterium]|nr:hypothetical protein [Armatimonadota bacterium]